MNVQDFDYTLPKALIAQYPAEERASSRLMVLKRSEGTIEDRSFTDIADYLHEGDTLVLNETKVFPARLTATKPTGGKIDILLLEKLTDQSWSCLAQGLRRDIKDFSVLVGDVPATLDYNGEFWTLRFPPGRSSDGILQKYGIMPLPRYIKRSGNGDPVDFDRYQTVYAKTEGSIAAPTAGFHFTRELLDDLQAGGVNIVKITLHIGIGTFFLIKTRHLEEHRMHGEYYQVTPEAKAQVSRAKAEGRRIIACGTSVVRTLETLYSENGNVPLAGRTDLYIYPGHRFRVVDAMITNFHLPRSTPLMLVSALTGREAILSGYREAVELGYRFYSYGDAMLIV